MLLCCQQSCLFPISDSVTYIYIKLQTILMPMLRKHIQIHIIKTFSKFSHTCVKCLSYIIDSLWPSDTISRQRYGSTLSQVMACCVTAPSHYLNQCWLIMIAVQWHSYSCNFTRVAFAISITKVCMKMTYLKFYSNFPGASELTFWSMTHFKTMVLFLSYKEVWSALGLWLPR